MSCQEGSELLAFHRTVNLNLSDFHFLLINFKICCNGTWPLTGTGQCNLTQFKNNAFTIFSPWSMAIEIDLHIVHA